VRTRDEIYEQVDKTRTDDGAPVNQWPSMTYAEGVEAALRWAVGDSDDEPMSDE